jgi:acyl carrier protein
MSTHQEITCHLLRALREQNIFEKDPETLLDTDLVEASLVDSLSMTMLQALIEEEFNIKLDQKTMINKLHTINDIINYLQEKSA